MTDPLLVLDSPPDHEKGAFWEREWVDSLIACTEYVPQMTDADLARALRWANENSCYYHSELNDLLEATVAEAAKRLERSSKKEE